VCQVVDEGDRAGRGYEQVSTSRRLGMLRHIRTAVGVGRRRGVVGRRDRITVEARRVWSDHNLMHGSEEVHT
jgi:hypothetical protein